VKGRQLPAVRNKYHSPGDSRVIGMQEAGFMEVMHAKGNILCKGAVVAKCVACPKAKQ
jgi:hypothetical protein